MRKRPAIRSCVACRGKEDQTKLIRLVWQKHERGGVIVVDKTKVAQGRGAYLHPRIACIAKIRDGKRIKAALRLSGEMPQVSDEVWSVLDHEMKSSLA